MSAVLPMPESRKMQDKVSHNSQVPLVVDLDGTLIRTDLLHESVFALLKLNPFYMFLLPLWLLKGKAYMKGQIAAILVRVRPLHCSWSF